MMRSWSPWFRRRAVLRRMQLPPFDSEVGQAILKHLAETPGVIRQIIRQGGHL